MWRCVFVVGRVTPCAPQMAGTDGGQRTARPTLDGGGAQGTARPTLSDRRRRAGVARRTMLAARGRWCVWWRFGLTGDCSSWPRPRCFGFCWSWGRKTVKPQMDTDEHRFGAGKERLKAAASAEGADSGGPKQKSASIREICGLTAPVTRRTSSVLWTPSPPSGCGEGKSFCSHRVKSRH